jgi:ethanolamine utilization protein EutN
LKSGFFPDNHQSDSEEGLRLFVAKVLGRVVATQKDEKLDGVKLLIIQPVRRDGSPFGKPMIAADSVGAGAGELVHAVRGREASFPLPKEGAPVDVAIAGIIDSIYS